jgi:hypothetical protein
MWIRFTKGTFSKFPIPGGTLSKLPNEAFLHFSCLFSKTVGWSVVRVRARVRRRLRLLLPAARARVGARARARARAELRASTTAGPDDHLSKRCSWYIHIHGRTGECSGPEPPLEPATL